MWKLHFWLTGALTVLLLPVCHAARLHIGNLSYVPAFMIGWIAQSIIWAGARYQLGAPGSWAALRKNWKRLLLAAEIPALVIPLFAFVAHDLEIGILISAIGIIVLEFVYRRGSWKSAASVLLPWTYLAFGIQLAFLYNSAIVSVRPFNLYDPLFQRLDMLLFHISVSGISRAASMLYTPAEVIYYAIGGVMGAGLLFLCLAGDRRAAFQMSGAILLSYYFSLLVFYIWPSHGPYALAAWSFPPGMVTGAVQRATYANAAALYHRTAWSDPALGYFVAFPSVHVAQPFIAGWFLRRWKGASLLIFAYCALLVPAIVILRWHYFVDIVAGLGIAGLAIAIVSRIPHPASAEEPALEIKSVATV